MFPQTHTYFAEKVLGKTSDAIALGSIFADMAIGAGVPRDLSHGSGMELFRFLEDDDSLREFALANITHGVSPKGLDYYGDETNPPFERGYCFEKGRSLVESTIRACNIPPEMGWWKSHNIIEMGIELHIGRNGYYGQFLKMAFQNHRLIEDLAEKMGTFFNLNPLSFVKQIENFPDYIDLGVPTAESQAKKYDYQMYYKHGIRVNIPEVAHLIRIAAEMVEHDMEEFFRSVLHRIRPFILSLLEPKPLMTSTK